MNWGYKLLLAFIVFGGMISYLVYRSFSTNFEMVESDYYKNELRYQQVIDGTDRANALGSAVVVKQTEKGVLLQMPAEMKNQSLSGTVWFYCAYDQKKDKKFDIKLDSDGSQSFTGTLKEGHYMVKIDWNLNGKNYYAEQPLSIL